MSRYRAAKLKWNLMAHGGGILFGMAIMGFWAVVFALGGIWK